MAPTFTNQLRQFITPVLDHHDPDQFEVFFYVEEADKEVAPPNLTLRSVKDVTAGSTAAMIRADKIDILVDLHGHFRLGKPAVIAHRPAPVQVSWMDYTHTVGLKAMDYVLHGDHMDVPGAQDLFVETIYNIGKVLVPFRPDATARTSPTPAATKGYVTFGCFNHPAKLGSPVIAAWARILKACPTAKLVLKYSVFADPVLCADMTARFLAHGVAPDQLLFRGHSKGEAYEQAFEEIDIALDPSPVTGGTTTMEALSRGVPVLCLKGDDFYARVGMHTLMAIGMPELLADTWDDYVRLARDLASDIGALQRLRARVRPALDASPYRDEAGFTRRLEAAYREMFERWLQSARSDPDAAQPPPPEAWELEYRRASALLAEGKAEAGEAALNDARIAHTIAVLRDMGLDVPRMSREPEYGLAAGYQLYHHKMAALASLALGCAITPQTATEESLTALGLSLQHQGRAEEAAHAFRAATDMFGSSEAHQFLLYSLFFVKDGVRRYADEARRWAERFTADISPLPEPFLNDRNPDRRLKIGFVAPRFTRSQLKQFILPVVDAHDPAKVDLYFYSEDPEAEDPLPGMVRKIGHLSDQDAARAIRADGIDVLVDLWGFTADGRLTVFAHRPAPVQVSWINLVQTTGMTAMDYVFHADTMDAPGTEALFTETVLRIGPITVPYQPAPDRPPPVASPAVNSGRITFGAFNHPARISDETVAAWARILNGRPGSRLILKYSYYADPVVRRVFQARFAGHGVDPDRIEFRGHTVGAAYLAAFAEIDLALDPSPCPGGTTTCDALANGVPVLTLRGADFYGRIGVHAVQGLPALIAESWDDYVEKALALTADVQALDRLRARVRPAFEASPVCDAVGFTRNLERVYRQIFAAWAAGQGA
jgi:predicted O-linked N-acetylglucosamine transferase (SPINDLY family)